MEQTIYFEEYEIGSVRESIGRTITAVSYTHLTLPTKA